jgi:Raf kinase inhibitor-like YbhB/YbcL family protein
MHKLVDIFLAAAIFGIIAGRLCWAGDQSRLLVGSPAFIDSGAIPDRYTCSGKDVSPPLNWTGVPTGAKTLVLVVDDPDAPSGTFTHWVVYNIDAGSSGLRENALNGAVPTVKYSQATNDFGHIGYNGPCPPPGKTHHYHFKLYVLSSALRLSHEATVKQVDEAMQGHILASGETIGTFAHFAR